MDKYRHRSASFTTDVKQRAIVVEKIVAEFKKVFLIDTFERLMTPDEIEYFEDFIHDGHNYAKAEPSELEDWLRSTLTSLILRTREAERREIIKNYGQYQCRCGCYGTIEEALTAITYKECREHNPDPDPHH